MSLKSVLPPPPLTSKTLPVIYPWEKTSLSVLSNQLYKIALNGGFTGTEQEFINNIISRKIFVDTTENWNSQLTYVPSIGDIIIYSDKTIVDGTNIPGIKIGDGNAYCVDLPFVTDDIAARLLEHINDTTKHITQQERQFWNNKINITISGEELQFNRN